MIKNRAFIILIIIIVIGGIIIGTGIIYRNTKYSLDKIMELLNSQTELPNNVYVEQENFYGTSTEAYLRAKIYIKDNVVYTYQDGTESQNIEMLYDFSRSELIAIVHDLKTITYFSTGSSKEYILSNNFNYDWLKEYKEQYKYLGKETIDNKTYIIFSITEDNIKNIFYIDVENKYISKTENYRRDNNEYKLETTVNYKYLYNVVKDEDILKFDSNNYQDYTVQGEIN